VELLTILCNPALRHELFPIVTMLQCGERWDQLKLAGSLLCFYDIPCGICAGLNIGVQNSLQSTFTPPNSLSMKENYPLIDVYYTMEGAAGCVSPSIWHDILLFPIGHFRTAPLDVHFPTMSAKPRIIQDHSFPRLSDDVHSLLPFAK
jgi:hypothetical protein